MTIDSVLDAITTISLFHLALISLFNPSKINSVANKWFGLFFFSAGCTLLNTIIYTHQLENNYPKLIALDELSRFILAPALFLAVLKLTSPHKIFKTRELMHFIPFLLFFVYTSPLVFGYSYHFTKGYSFIPAAFQHLPAMFVGLFAKIQLMVYWAAAMYRLYQHRKNIRLIHADLNPFQLVWLHYLLLALGVMILVGELGSIQSNMWLNGMRPAVYLIGVLITGYFLLAQKEIYPFEKLELQEIGEVINDAQPKSVIPRLEAAELEGYKEKLTQLMKTSQVYLNSELNLPDLAELMGLSTHDLSYVLNQGFDRNFFQFINGYRVEEAKRLLLQGKHQQLNFLGIAYKAGFNSKTTFNTSFKKETGLSPSQFKQSCSAG